MADRAPELFRSSPKGARPAIETKMVYSRFERGPKLGSNTDSGNSGPW